MCLHLILRTRKKSEEHCQTGSVLLLLAKVFTRINRPNLSSKMSVKNLRMTLQKIIQASRGNRRTKFHIAQFLYCITAISADLSSSLYLLWYRKYFALICPIFSSSARLCLVSHILVSMFLHLVLCTIFLSVSLLFFNLHSSLLPSLFSHFPSFQL